MYLLHIKEKEGQYLRFIICSEEKSYFRERYIAFEGWEKIEKRFLEIVKNINKKIQVNIFPKSEFQNLENEVRFFIINHLDLVIEKTRLKVIWEANIFLPFEVIKEFSVINMIYSSYKQDREKNKFTLIYSDEVENSRFEVYKIAEILRREKKLTIEYFKEKEFLSFKSDICRANYIHISTHGKMEDKTGKIFIGGKWTSSLDLKLNCWFLFFNSCEVGLYPYGIIKDSILNGTKYLIASPYQIFDNINWKMKTFSFYEKFDLTSFEKSFFEYKSKNYLFGLFFRLFMAI
ncbi:MAG: hypothetical protein N2258_05620 [Brevinematales bacterium]|nr:hypothetical protein [Brevinematales bacterium]